jgi:hypothetical protein
MRCEGSCVTLQSILSQFVHFNGHAGRAYLEFMLCWHTLRDRQDSGVPPLCESYIADIMQCSRFNSRTFHGLESVEGCKAVILHFFTLHFSCRRFCRQCRKRDPTGASSCSTSCLLNSSATSSTVPCKASRATADFARRRL